MKTIIIYLSHFAEESHKLQLLPPRPAVLPVHHALHEQRLGPDDQKLYQTQEKSEVKLAKKHSFKLLNQVIRL